MSATTAMTANARPSAGDSPSSASPASESALPTRAAVPARIPGERPMSGASFATLVLVELRKMLDTRAGRWLLIAIGAVIATTLVIMFFNNGGQHTFVDYLTATTMPQALILPVVGILAVTSEWSQRTGLVTYGLEPRRARVSWAKFVAALSVGAAAIVLSFALAALAHQGAVTFRGITADWTIDGLTVLGAALYVLLGVAQGVGFGMLMRNTPAAIVVYFVLPTAWALLGGLVSWLDSAARWLDLSRTMDPLFSGAMTGEQWAQLGVSVGVWVALPVAIGMWMLRRAEVK